MKLTPSFLSKYRLQTKLYGVKKMIVAFSSKQKLKKMWKSWGLATFDP
jgi:hypothetical protein